jgi:hypothetical protein
MLDDVESDMSVFHRIDDISKLPANKFFRLAERLPYYTGAVQATMRIMAETVQPEPEAPKVIDAVSAASLPTVPGMPALFEFSGS